MTSEYSMIARPTHKRVCYFYHDDIGNYHYGSGHPMKPHRIRLTDDLLRAYGVTEHLDRMIPIVPDTNIVTQFHGDDYVEFLQSVNSNTISYFSDHVERFSVGDDCPVMDGLWEFCTLYTGASIGAAQQLTSQQYFYAVNWSGGLHHAKKQEASGFCYLNDCVLAALELLRCFKRVLYVDIDNHHGDGVEEAFYTSPRVMCVSFHKYGDYFPGTGSLEDIGAEAGRGYSVNVPLKDGMDDATFESLFQKVLDVVVDRFRPEALILQGGADSLAGDRLGCFNLTTTGHSAALRYLKKQQLPLLALGGGGYTLRNVPRCWAVETAILADITLPQEIPENTAYRYYYAPEHLLRIRPSNMKNLNTELHLNHVLETVTDTLRQYVCPYSPQLFATNDPSRPSDPKIPTLYGRNDEDVSEIDFATV